MTVTTEPLFFQPIYKQAIWGGNALFSKFGRPLSPDQTVGESWEIASHGVDQSRLISGARAGATLGELVKDSPETIFGKIATFDTFPLLYKFIDARDRLSVQVHPDDEQARANGWGEFGKTECWYVVDAKKNASIIAGFTADVTRAMITRAIENATLHELLNFIPVAPGDLLFIPPGTVHAIMDGTLIYEVQETSDTTLRLYDWGRVDARGQPRQLHVRDALTVLDMRSRGDYRIPPVTFEDGGCLHSYRVACRFFAVEQYSFLRDTDVIVPHKQSFRVISVMAGSIDLHNPNGTAHIPAGGTVLLPATAGDVRAAGAAGTNIIHSWVPDLQREIIAPLESRGVSAKEIERLGGFRERNDLARFFGGT